MKNVDISTINKSIFLSILTVIAFIGAMVGVSYAFFSISVSGNETASSVSVDVVDLGRVTFLDGNVINVDNIYPMRDGERISKTFTISSEGNEDPIDYTIYFLVSTNTFIQNYENEFTYTLSGYSSNSGIVSSTINTEVPAASATPYAIGTGVLNDGGDVHTYTFTIGLNEMESNQNYNQGKSFAGRLSVGTKKYTNERSEWEG